MNQLKTLLSVCTLVLAAMGGLVSCQEKDKPVVLKLNLEKGKTYEYDMDMHMKMHAGQMSDAMDMKMGYSMKVADVKDNDQILDVTYHRIMMDAPTGPGMPRMHYDSDKPDASTESGKIFGALSDARFTVVMTPEGKVKEVRGIREMYKNMLSKAGVPRESISSMQIEQLFSEESARQQLEQGFNYLPNKEVKVGDTWQKQQELPAGQMPIKLSTTYTVKDIKANSVILDVNSIMSLPDVQNNPQMQGAQVKGGLSGPMEVDKHSGFPLSSEMKMDMLLTQGKDSMKLIGDMKLNGKVK